MERMTFGRAIKTCFSKYCVFKGRAQRAEYWYFVLFCFLVNWVLSTGSMVKLMPTLLAEGPGRTTNPFEIYAQGGVLMYAYLLFSLVVLLPTLAAMVRRLHDTNRSGWWVLAYYLFIIVGEVVVFIIAGDSFSTGGVQFALAMMIFGLGMLAVSIVLLVWLCTAGTKGPNKYGPDPLGSQQEENIVDVSFTVDPSGNDTEKEA